MQEKRAEDLVFYPCDDSGDITDPEIVNQMTEEEATEYMRKWLAKQFLNTVGLTAELCGDVDTCEIFYSRDEDIRFEFDNGNIIVITLESYKNASYIERVQGFVAVEQIRYIDEDYAEYYDERIVAEADTEDFEEFCEFIATQVYG